jgi:uncharacterized protein
MDYIQQAYKGFHEWWRYLVGFILIIAIWFFGQLPHGVVLIWEAKKQGISIFGMDTAQLMQIMESNLNLFLMLLSFAIGLLGVWFVVKFLHNQTFTALTTARKKIDWRRFWFMFIFWGVVSSSMILLEVFVLSPENMEFNFKLVPFLILSVIAILMIPLQTSFEEYLFRGYLMQGIGVIAKNRWLPLIITSTIFGLMHSFNPEIDTLGYVVMVYYIGTGFFLGILTLMDEGMELALGFHAANNLFTALLLTADWTAFQTHSIFRDVSIPEKAGFMEVFLPVVILYPILLFIFSKVYKWSNWQQKLFGKVVEPPQEPEELPEILVEPTLNQTDSL